MCRLLKSLWALPSLRLFMLLALFSCIVGRSARRVAAEGFPETVGVTFSGSSDLDPFTGTLTWPEGEGSQYSAVGGSGDYTVVASWNSDEMFWVISIDSIDGMRWFVERFDAAGVLPASLRRAGRAAGRFFRGSGR